MAPAQLDRGDHGGDRRCGNEHAEGDEPRARAVEGDERDRAAPAGRARRAAPRRARATARPPRSRSRQPTRRARQARPPRPRRPSAAVGRPQTRRPPPGGAPAPRRSARRSRRRCCRVSRERDNRPRRGPRQPEASGKRSSRRGRRRPNGICSTSLPSLGFNPYPGLEVTRYFPESEKRRRTKGEAMRRGHTFGGLLAIFAAAAALTGAPTALADGGTPGDICQQVASGTISPDDPIVQGYCGPIVTVTPPTTVTTPSTVTPPVVAPPTAAPTVIPTAAPTTGVAGVSHTIVARTPAPTAAVKGAQHTVKRRSQCGRRAARDDEDVGHAALHRRATRAVRARRAGAPRDRARPPFDRPPSQRRRTRFDA